MENTHSQYLLLFLLSLSTSPPPRVEASVDRFRVITRYGRYSWNRCSWQGAKNHCRSAYAGNGDLAVAKNAHEVEQLSTKYGCYYSSCWVGLHKTDNVWTWVNGQNNSLPDTTWASGHLSYSCGAIYGKKLYGRSCSWNVGFLCEKTRLVFVKEQKTWEEALNHCRALEASKQMELLSFHDEEELSYAQEEMALTQTEEAWIGLRWLAGRWLWMDRTAGADISLPECPANGTHCGILSGRGQHARTCVERRSFFCLKQA